MKSIIFFLVSLLALTVVTPKTSEAQLFKKKKPSSKNIKVVWNQESHDFGTVELGNYPGYEFTFTNNGNVPVQIQEFNRACGFTVPTYTNTTIEPGETGSFKLIMNPRDIKGKFNRTMEIVFVNATDSEDKHVEEIDLTGKVLRSR